MIEAWLVVASGYRDVFLDAMEAQRMANRLHGTPSPLVIAKRKDDAVVAWLVESPSYRQPFMDADDAKRMAHRQHGTASPLVIAKARGDSGEFVVRRAQAQQREQEDVELPKIKLWWRELKAMFHA